MPFTTLAAGDPAPSFVQRAIGNPRYSFDSAAGRWLVLAFHHSLSDPAVAARLAKVKERGDLFDDHFASLFTVSTDPEDESAARIANRLPGFRVFWDHDLSVSRRYGAVDSEGQRRGMWVAIDPTLRILEVIPFLPDGSDAERLLALLDGLPRPDRFAGVELQAPILFLPRVFEPELCQQLISLYEAQGGEISGFMREVDGKTVGLHDPRHKVRRDVNVSDDKLIAVIQNRILRRIVPEIKKVHMFHATRMERYLVACYDGAEGGHFAPHRDNTTAGTAHRRFAVSINLNDDFDGGEVSFPEYGPRGFKAPAGGAVVFSCSLLHAVSKVTRGRRYAFLPFLYDDAAAAIRDANRHKIAVSAEPGHAAKG
jgi:predicted 2-oxoglutarate/Fe(II)-dependent dioxygenase YbiX/peroxiredoxin